MSTPACKLSYFNAASVGEPIRWILHYAQVPFEDERISYRKWPKEKHRFPNQQVPVFYLDGVEMTQSSSIIRYLARRFDLVPKDELMNYRVDQVTEVVKDGFYQWHKIIEEDSPKEVEKIKENLINNFCPRLLSHLSDLVGMTDDEGPFIAGSQVSYGDFVLANWLQVWEKTVSPDLLAKHPILIKQKEAVEAIPQIKDWLKVRPVTDL